MGVYLDFKDYSQESIKKRPQRFKTKIKDKKFVFEISYNRVTEGLSLGIYDEAEVQLISKLPITAGVNLVSMIPEALWPPDVKVWGQWVVTTNKSISEAFMREFKIYLGGA